MESYQLLRRTVSFDITDNSLFDFIQKQVIIMTLLRQTSGSYSRHHCWILPISY